MSAYNKKEKCYKNNAETVVNVRYACFNLFTPFLLFLCYSFVVVVVIVVEVDSISDKIKACERARRKREKERVGEAVCINTGP